MKKELRKKYLLIRKNVKNKEIKDNLVYNKVINNQKLKESKLVLIYVSTKEEVSTINIINNLLKNRGCFICSFS